MLKSLAVIFLAFAGVGCAKPTDTARVAATQPDRVTVLVDNNGELMSGGFSLAKSDVPAFVQELHGRGVNLRPFAPVFTGYDKAVAAKKTLEAAGVRSITVGDKTD